LLFVRRGTLMAQPFDARSAELTGDPIALIGSIKHHPEGDAAFDLSRNGVLLYRSSEGLPTTRLLLMDRRGREVQEIARGIFREVRFSPDTSRIVAERAEQEVPNPDVWVFDIAGRTEVRLTRDPAPDIHPIWSSDGRRVVFSSKRGSTYDVYEKTVDSTVDEQIVYASPQDKIVEDWSKDGRLFAITIPRVGLWTYDLVGHAMTLVRPTSAANTVQAQFAPDAKWIAYAADDTGRPEVYVEPLPATGARWRISQAGGAEPHWRADGRELIFVAADGWLMSVNISPGPGWRPDVPQRLFKVEIPDLFGATDIAVTPDADRFVVNSLVTEVTVPPVHVVVKWLSLLKH
jgi:eukaryotic-like serine/threonine-protein kinase